MTASGVTTASGADGLGRSAASVVRPSVDVGIGGRDGVSAGAACTAASASAKTRTNASSAAGSEPRTTSSSVHSTSCERSAVSGTSAGRQLGDFRLLLRRRLRPSPALSARRGCDARTFTRLTAPAGGASAGDEGLAGEESADPTAPDLPASDRGVTHPTRHGRGEPPLPLSALRILLLRLQAATTTSRFTLPTVVIFNPGATSPFR